MVYYIPYLSFVLSKNFKSILNEHYSGTEIGHIDQLQSSWRRSLNFAFEDRLGDRLFDILICIREGMLNALVHGCEGSPDKFTHLQISVDESSNVLRVIVDDPGIGHTFDLNESVRLTKNNTKNTLGLGIIQHLSDSLEIQNRGTSLVFDFKISSKDN